MKHVKRLVALSLAAMLMVSLLPATALAAGESGIQLGTAGLKAKDEIYFGNYTQSGTTYDVPWIALSKGTNEAFLLSKYLLGNSQFQARGSGYYSGGTLNTYMDALYNGTGFTPQERGAIATVTSLNCVGGGNSSSPSVSNAHLYPLSNNEAAALTWGSDTLKAPYITNSSGSAGWWWLRSSYSAYYAFYAAEDGYEGTHPVDSNYGARPALNLDLSSVLFTSAAVGGKSSGAVGAGAFNSNLTPSTTSKNTWKLTLLDSTRTFNVTTTAVSTTTAGGNVSIAYSGAKVGASQAPEYLSAMLVDGSGNVLYYGRLKSIAASGDAAGTQDIAIPALSAGTYTLKIFNEQYNGDYNTDYSSAIEDVTLTVNAATTITDPTQNKTVTVTVGKTAALSVTAQNATEYQWYVNRGDGNGFVAIPSAAGTSYTTSAVTMANNGYQYRCVVGGAKGTDPITSPVFTLRVVAAPEIPATGDSATPVLWLGIALLAILGLAGNRVALKKRRGK